MFPTQKYTFDNFATFVICDNNGNLKNTDRLKIERTLPVAKYMWQSWDKVRTNQGMLINNLPWRNESEAIQLFFNKIMFEAGRLTSRSCEVYFNNCHNFMTEKVFTDKGLCTKIYEGMG